MLEIKSYTKSSLKAFINSEEYHQLSHLPISPHRAISHCNNPRVNEEDKLLFVAYINDELVGYLGALPDDIIQEGKTTHLAWLSCLWVNPVHRGKKVAQKLLNSCFLAWENKIIITEFTPEAKILYDKSGIFTDLKKSNGIRLYFKSESAKILPTRKLFYKRIKPILYCIDSLINVLFFIKNIFYKPIKSSYTTSDQFYMEKLNPSNNLFKRNQKEFLWMFNNPWILSKIDNNIKNRYHFSAYDNTTKFQVLTIEEKDHFAILFIRNGHLKIPYLFSDELNKDKLIKAIVQYAENNKCTQLSCFNEDYVDIFLNTKSKAIYRKPIQRSYLISKEIEINKDFSIQDGDGDAAFT